MSSARQRITNAIHFAPVDKLPVRIYAAPGGYYTHGEKLHELLCACGHDFGPTSEFRMPPPIPPEHVDTEGNYHAKRLDEWGVEWEFRIPGVQGHPCAYPLADWAALETFLVPPLPSGYTSGIKDSITREANLRQEFFRVGSVGTVLERMHALRSFEDILVEIQLADEHAVRLADILFARVEELVRAWLRIGCDAISFGDDFGVSTGPLFPPNTWREFFFPRYQKVMDLVHTAGKTVFMHSCGKVDSLLPDFREMGVQVLWPQITSWEMQDLAKRSRDLGLVLELHPDRGNLMHHGTAQDVRDYIRRMIEVFAVGDGGSWLYVEIEPGFRWETTEALILEIMARR
jgi:hypothetical protein